MEWNTNLVSQLREVYRVSISRCCEIHTNHSTEQDTRLLNEFVIYESRDICEISVHALRSQRNRNTVEAVIISCGGKDSIGSRMRSEESRVR
jgi:hypothetical protein